jgi:hypothetical protein
MSCIVIWYFYYKLIKRPRTTPLDRPMRRGAGPALQLVQRQG